MKELHGTVDDMARQSKENDAEYFRRLRPLVSEPSRKASGTAMPAPQDAAPLPAGDLGALDDALAAQNNLYRSMGYSDSEGAAPEEGRLPTQSLPSLPERKEATSGLGDAQTFPPSGNRGRSTRSAAIPNHRRNKSPPAGVSRTPHASAVPLSRSTKLDAPHMPTALSAIFARPAILPGQQAEQFRQLHEQIRQSLIATLNHPRVCLTR
jgi:hypothetical protein